jgi:hypothetical protein
LFFDLSGAGLDSGTHLVDGVGVLAKSLIVFFDYAVDLSTAFFDVLQKIAVFLFECLPHIAEDSGE